MKIEKGKTYYSVNTGERCNIVAITPTTVSYRMMLDKPGIVRKCGLTYFKERFTKEQVSR